MPTSLDKGIQFCSAAVLQSKRGKRLAVGGERFEAGGLRLEAEDEMSKFKIQMSN